MPQVRQSVPGTKTMGRSPHERMRSIPAEGFGKKAFNRIYPLLLRHSSRPYRNNGANTSVTVASSLISTCSDGPAVSLNGSPTVSPTTAAL